MRRFALGLSVICATSLGVVAAARSGRPAERPVTGDAVRSAVEDSVAQESTVRDLDIALYERRVTDDPMGAADRGRLAGLYLRRGRETGAFRDFERAESIAVSGLRLREAYNDETLSVLASTRLALHDFTGALEAAHRLVKRNPGEASHRALLGEVLLELGRYDEAAVAFRAVEGETGRVSVAPRLARWYELTGRLEHARDVMRYALRRAGEERTLSREQEGWFHLRLGELELKSGEVERAESLFVTGLRRSPGDHRLLGAMARAAAQRGDWPAAIGAGERALGLHLDPTTLGTMSDAYAALGDWAQASSYAAAMRVSALVQPGPIHRAWGLFLLDHGERATDVLRRARRELETRRDVYGYDLAAWALHVLGRDEEAWPLMQRALAQNTEDVLLWHHAAEVAKARGDEAKARELAQRVILINPRFRRIPSRLEVEAERSPESRVQSPESVARNSRGSRQ